MKHYKNITECRICYSKSLVEVLKIDEQHLSPTFVSSNKNNVLSKIKVPQTLVLCHSCNLLQLKETVNPDLLYTNYFYRTSINDTMKKDLGEVVDSCLDLVELKDNDFVVDIGANDCTMLSYFPKNLKRVGVEPAENIDWSNVDSSITIVNDYFSKSSLDRVLNNKKAKIVTACAMFYDIDKPNDFVSDVKEILHPDGVWCIQISYLPLMLENMNFYDICNEHLEYYSLHTLQYLMQRNGLSVFHAEQNNVNGGSIKVFITHAEKNVNTSKEYNKLYKKEKQLNLNEVNTYFGFKDKMEDLKNKIADYVKGEIKSGNLVVGLGASTKGNMLLQFFGINKEMLPYISERNPAKVGLKTLGTDIELVSEEYARKLNPSCMLVMPWYFKDEIVNREKEYIQSGGKLLFPMPYAHVVHKGGETLL